MRDRNNNIKGRWNFLKTFTALGLVMVLLILPSVGGYADVSEALEGSFTLTVGLGNNDDEILNDLRSADITIDLYKIADARKVSGYDTFEFVMKTNPDGSEDKTYGSLFSEDLASITNHDITGDEWEAVAQKAAAIVFDVDQGTAVQKPELSGKSESEISVPSPGLYLVAARGNDASYVKKAEDGSVVTIGTSDTIEYSFSPQLISFPSKDADEDGVINTANTGDWLTDVSINLKYRYEQRKGSLDIIKGLDVYETKDPATFVFQVEGKDKYGNVIFSNSYSMVFDKPGEQKITIDDLPAGTVVTVTEAYSGSNYRQTSALQADPIKAKDVVKAEFKNTYDDTYKGGGSIENVFTKEEDGWHWYGIDDDGNKYEIKQD